MNTLAIPTWWSNDQILSFLCLENCTKSLFITYLFSSFFAHLSYKGNLKKWDTVDEVHKSVDIPEAPKKDAQGVPGHIPLPPPPPPGGLAGVAALSNLMKPFSKATQRGSESPASSVYSPGMNYYFL